MRNNPVYISVIIFFLCIAFPNYSKAEATSFVANPQTPYAKEFLQKCEDEQWFIEQIEKLLNFEQKSINTLNGKSDFNNITSIGIAGEKISGKIPAAIGELQNLENLFLSGNALSGELPVEMLALQKLKNIDISDNEYSGKIPDGFGNMPALKILILKGNRYTGNIPTSILSNSELKIFDVSSNELTGKIPKELNQMTGLEYLGLSDNAWAIGEMPDLSSLDSLKCLSAWRCNMIGEIPDNVYTLNNLQILDLANNYFSGKISPKIGDLTNLEMLSIGGNNLNGTIPTEIANLVKLKTLDISGNKLRGHMPQEALIIEKVYAQGNYMTGNILNQMLRQEGNFCDPAASPQYRLAKIPTLQISTAKQINVYKYLSNIGVNSTAPDEKPLLSPGAYIATVINDVDGKITVTVDASGIYVKSNAPVKIEEDIELEIRIRDNDGSEYSKTSFLLTTEMASTAAPFTDAAPAEVQKEEHFPYINGYKDGTFGVGKTVSREEIVAMLTRAMKYELKEIKYAPFFDVSKERWSAKNIATVKKKGIIQGYGDGTFAPARGMSRAELAAVLVRVSKTANKKIIDSTEDGKEDSLPGFRDVEMTSWYGEYVHEAVRYGLIKGYEDNTFRPDNSVLREEAVAMINRLLGRNPETAEELKIRNCPFSDFEKKHWAYLDIMEAGIRHKH